MMKEMDDRRRSRPHSLQMDRRKATVYGVDELDSFNETEIVMATSEGTLTVEGENLHIEKLNLDDGQLVITGMITALLYTDPEPVAQGGFFNRLLGR